MTEQPTTRRPDRQPPAGQLPGNRRPATLDVPLLIEQLQEQIDQLLDTVAAQQTVIEHHAARLAALERH